MTGPHPSTLSSAAPGMVSPSNLTTEISKQWLHRWRALGLGVASLEAHTEQRGATGILGCLAAAMDLVVAGWVFDDLDLGRRAVHPDCLARCVPGAVVGDVVGRESARRAHVAPLCLY